MQIHDFAKVYQAKSDGELVQLAAAPEQLTTEARLALQGELSRRHISTAEDSTVSLRNGDSHHAGRVTVSQRLQPEERQGVGDFVAETLRTYHADFLLYFRITVPAVIISTVAIIASRHEARVIMRHLPRGVELVAHQILEMGLINFSAWFIGWTAFSFMFGATCMTACNTGASAAFEAGTSEAVQSDKPLTEIFTL